MTDERLEAIRERLETDYSDVPDYARRHLRQKLGLQLVKDLRYLLDRIEAQREVVEAARLKRNTLIREENGKSFSGEWVAVPREDFDRLRRALDNLEEQTDD